MRKNRSINIELKHCHPAPMSKRNATEECLGVIAIVAAGWGAFAALVLAHLSAADTLDKLLSKSDATLAFDFATGILGLLITVKLINYAREALRIAVELERGGTTASGVIIDTWRNDAECYHLSYRFRYLGAVWIGEQAAESPVDCGLQIGDSVTIRFLPHNPRISRLLDEQAIQPSSLSPTEIKS